MHYLHQCESQVGFFLSVIFFGCGGLSFTLMELSITLGVNDASHVRSRMKYHLTTTAAARLAGEATERPKVHVEHHSSDS